MPVNLQNPNAMDTKWTPFATTHWSVVLTARDSAAAEISPALSHLCQTYWPPLYGFLRRQGYPRHDAQDLVQGFFERFVEHDVLQRVERDKGRFRCFLLASLQNYVANRKRDERAQRRGGGTQRIELDVDGVLERCEAALGTETTPEVTFDRLWAETVMEQAARRLRAEYESRGRGAFYEAVCRWLAREPGPGEYAAAAPELGLNDGALAAAVFRLRRRFRELIREEVAHTVQTPDAVQAEIRYLLQVLTSG